MPNGYWGKIIFANLSTGQIEVEQPPEELYRRYLGGYGLGVYYLCQRIPPGADPLGPDNMLGFLPGLLTGSGAQFGGRFMVVGRSPLTGAWGDANCGGNFGPALRGAGYDGLFVTGASEHPLYLYVDGEKVELRDASALWGLDAAQTQDAIRKATSPDVRVACIGPAGEKLSLISGIVNDGGRLAARCGLGAVMGAKKLKAVAARGKQHPPQADPKTFKAITSEYIRLFRRRPSSLVSRIPGLLNHLLPLIRRLGIRINAGPGQMAIDAYRRYGTTVATSTLVELGDTPVRNWAGIGFRDFPLYLSEGLSDDAAIRPVKRSYACHSCPLACGGTVHMPNGEPSHRPEYETLAALGPLVMNSNLDAVMECNHICNAVGLDTISTGVAIAFAMECYEKGWLPPELTQELPLQWGDSQVIVELTRRIAQRAPGLGDWLADGVQRAAQRLRPEAQQAAIHAGGQELPMHRSLFEPGLAVGFQLDPAPGRHTSNMSGIANLKAFEPYFALNSHRPAERYNYAAHGHTQAITIPIMRAYDSLGLCMFALQVSDPPILGWLNAATGWNFDYASLLRAGKRIQVLRHAFNARHGLPTQFPLPARERGDPPQPIGPLAKRTVDTETMAAGYFAALGLDPATGWPCPETIKELELEAIPFK